MSMARWSLRPATVIVMSSSASRKTAACPKRSLTATINRKLLIIWDGLPAHRSRVVRNYVESLDGCIALERLLGYARERNPIEYLFGYAKQRELGNLCLETIAEVRRYATRRLKSMQRRPTLIRAFWRQAELPI